MGGLKVNDSSTVASWLETGDAGRWGNLAFLVRDDAGLFVGA